MIVLNGLSSCADPIPRIKAKNLFVRVGRILSAKILNISMERTALICHFFLNYISYKINTFIMLVLDLRLFIILFFFFGF